jgi:hypothetical protein
MSGLDSRFVLVRPVPLNPRVAQPLVEQAVSGKTKWNRRVGRVATFSGVAIITPLVFES